jgi:hypothetical protein
MKKTTRKQAKSKSRKQAKKSIRRQKRSVITRAKLPQGHIDLIIDHENTLNELSHELLNQYYRIHYTPIKQLCSVHNTIYANKYIRSNAEMIEQIVDLKIEVMNQWLDQALENARIQASKKRSK